jgi:hypothetical protein
MMKGDFIMSNLFWLSRSQLNLIKPYFPPSRGVPRVDDLRVVSGIIFVLKRGLQWRDAPKEYGTHTGAETTDIVLDFSTIELGNDKAKSLDLSTAKSVNGLNPHSAIAALEKLDSRINLATPLQETKNRHFPGSGAPAFAFADTAKITLIRFNVTR